MKFLYTRFALLAATSLAFAAHTTPASAQTATPTSSTSGCTTGCPGTSQVGIATMGGVQGQFMGAFGSFNQAGDPVADDTIEGGVEGYKEGEVHAFGEVTLTGPACVTCAQTGVNGRVTAQETAGVAVWLSGHKAGVVYGGANSATVGTAGAIGTVFQPYVPTSTGTHTGN